MRSPPGRQVAPPSRVQPDAFAPFSGAVKSPPTNGVDASGWTRDGGATWRPGGDLSGYRSGVDWIARSFTDLVAVGPTGSDFSTDGGRTWTPFDTAPYDAVDCVPTTCWASGPAGAVAKLVR